MAKKYSAKIEIDGDASDAVRAAKRTESAYSKLGSFLRDRLVITLGDVTQAFQRFTKVLGSAVDAADKQAEAVNAANQALKNAGSFSEEASRGVQDWASALQRATTFGDEQTLQLFALARAYTQTDDQAKLLVETAQDLSFVTGRSATRAIRQLGQATEGSAESLEPLVDGIGELTDAELKAGRATELLAEKYGGTARSVAQLSSGIRQQLLNALGDLNETFGEALTKNEDFNQAIADLRDIVSAPETAQGIRTLTNVLIELVKIEDRVRRFGPLGKIWNLFTSDAARNTAAWVQSLFGANTALAALNEGAKTAADGVNALTDAELRAKRINDELSGTVKELGEELDRFGVTLLPEVNKQIRDNNEVLAKARDAYARSARTVDGELVVSYEKLLEIEQKIQAENERLVQSLDGTAQVTAAAAEATTNYGTSVTQAAQSTAELNVALEQSTRNIESAGRAAVFTAAQFDALAASQGRAAAVSAGVAGGGQLILGGTRINLPGGGSRLVNDPQPFGTSNLGGPPVGTSARSSLGRPRL